MACYLHTSGFIYICILLYIEQEIYTSNKVFFNPLKVLCSSLKILRWPEKSLFAQKQMQEEKSTSDTL